jgi:hypothetical protein
MVLSTRPEAMQLPLFSIARLPSLWRKEIDLGACRKLLLAALSPQATLVHDLWPGTSTPERRTMGTV